MLSQLVSVQKKVKQTKEALNQKQKNSINDQEGFV